MVFLDFALPNATTWFYFSMLLGMALFFKFSRLLSVRNLDVITLFLLVPGLLLLQDPGVDPVWGYSWLLAGSVYFLVRCLVDLVLVRRPFLHANLNFGGLAWMAATLFFCLVAVAIFRREGPTEHLGQEPPLTLEAEKQARLLVHNETGQGPGRESDVEFWVGRSLAIACHLVIVIGILCIGRLHFQGLHAGMAAATFYLLLPYTAANFGQWHHVLPMALVVWAVAAYRKPLLAGTLLGLAAGTVYFPVLMVPAWWSFYRGRGAGRFLAGFGLVLGLCLLATGLILWKHNDLVSGLDSLRSVAAWQPWVEPKQEPGFWHGMRSAWVYRIPVSLASMTLVLVTAFWPWPKNLAHLIALSAASVISLQFWYADEGGTYMLWYLPLLLLLVFRPNLSDRRPPVILPESDWLHRLGRWIFRHAARLPGVPASPIRQP